MTLEDIVAHVNTYQAGAFFAALLPWLAGDPLPAATAPLARFGLVSRLRGIGLTLYRLDLTSGDPLDAVVIAQVRFYPAAVLPYGLDDRGRVRTHRAPVERGWPRRRTGAGPWRTISPSPAATPTTSLAS